MSVTSALAAAREIMEFCDDNLPSACPFCSGGVDDLPRIVTGEDLRHDEGCLCDQLRIALAAMDDPKGSARPYTSGFKCPTCGSSFFSSEMRLGGEIVIRRCKGHYPHKKRGYEYTGCTFTWVPADDEKYGMVNPGSGRVR